jgi:hypothetical protein
MQMSMLRSPNMYSYAICCQKQRGELVKNTTSTDLHCMHVSMHVSLLRSPNMYSSPSAVRRAVLKRLAAADTTTRPSSTGSLLMPATTPGGPVRLPPQLLLLHLAQLLLPWSGGSPS